MAGDVLMTEAIAPPAAPIHLVIVDLGGEKDTLEILTSLNQAYPVAVNPPTLHPPTLHTLNPPTLNPPIPHPKPSNPPHPEPSQNQEDEVQRGVQKLLGEVPTQPHNFSFSLYLRM